MPPNAQHVDLEEFQPKPGNFMVSASRTPWQRFNGHGRKRVGFFQSLKAVALSSYLNIYVVFIPVAWVSHFRNWNHDTTFWLCFFALIPLEKLFEWCGEQMALYFGSLLGDLLVVTLNNVVEATLAITLLTNCELKILQSTIIGIIILHLSLVPGRAFLFGGSNIWEQHLHPHLVELNNTLLMVGVMSIVLPTALFSALDRSSITPGDTILPSDELRSHFLHFSRGTAIVLLIIYICSRIFLINPPGEGSALENHPSTSDAIKERERHLAEADPEANSWVCITVIAITIGLVAVTVKFLVETLEYVREEGRIREEWFGLILLPLVSYAADGAIAGGFFLRTSLQHFLGKPKIPSELARGRAIDLSVQFTLFWMPFFILLAWSVNKPLHLLFDYYEVTALLASVFLVNYITSNATTNWVEGLMMVGFYVVIASWTWFYVGQPAQVVMLACGTSVAEALANEVTKEGTNQLAARLI